MANGSSILTGIYSGLASTYSYLSQVCPDGVTQESINNVRSDSQKSLNLNQSFASFLQNDFSSIDKNGDGIISADEINNYTNNLATQGLTRQQLTQLAVSGGSGMSADQINKILEHFDEMDKNHDGKITSAEISAYGYEATRQEKVDEYNYKKATDMSTFYGSESSSDVDSYSMLSYRYKNYNK